MAIILAALPAAAKAVQAEYEFIYDVPAIHCDIGNIFFGWIWNPTQTLSFPLAAAIPLVVGRATSWWSILSDSRRDF
jgi:hypothetical protein